MTQQDLFQSRQQRPTLFAQGREIAADAAEGRGSGKAAKAAGDLLLHFDHAQIPLGLIVVEGDGEVVREGQERHLVR